MGKARKRWPWGSVKESVARASPRYESGTLTARVRVCLVYDCLYPCTIGGAERWYRNVAERLVGEGYEVTYLTLRQWERGRPPEIPGVEVIAVGPRAELYVDGRRRMVPPLLFGLGVLVHLLRHGRRYGVVHTASFPYFSLLAAGLARTVHRFPIVADWHEVWTRSYWRDYVGAAAGGAGWAVQRLCARVPQRAFCFSQLHAGRLRELGMSSEVTVLTGEYAGDPPPPDEAPVEPVVVFAGRHIPEKRVPALVAAFETAHRQVPDLRCEIYGDGPERAEVLRRIEQSGLEDRISCPGFVPDGTVERALRRAMCMVLPSRREGYALVVVEASASGTPSVVVRDPDNAATELIDDGENGVIAESAQPAELARAIVRVHDAGQPLRSSTAAWFLRNRSRLSLSTSLDSVVAGYPQAGSTWPQP